MESFNYMLIMIYKVWKNAKFFIFSTNSTDQKLKETVGLNFVVHSLSQTFVNILEIMLFVKYPFIGIYFW